MYDPVADVTGKLELRAPRSGGPFENLMAGVLTDPPA
jgi:hypothetical protein